MRRWLVRLEEKPGRNRDRKIFVIRQPGRLQTNAAGKEIQHLLIFDDHPDSLRMVFGRGPNLRDDPSADERVISWELILVFILITSALVAMLWSMF